MFFRRKCCSCYRYPNEYKNNIEFKKIDLNELSNMRRNGLNIIIIDVRSPQEYEEGHINGSICIPSYDIIKKAESIIPDKNISIVAYCNYGNRSRKAASILNQMGYNNVYILDITR